MSVLSQLRVPGIEETVPKSSWAPGNHYISEHRTGNIVGAQKCWSAADRLMPISQPQEAMGQANRCDSESLHRQNITLPSLLAITQTRSWGGHMELLYQRAKEDAPAAFLIWKFLDSSCGSNIKNHSPKPVQTGGWDDTKHASSNRV